MHVMVLSGFEQCRLRLQFRLSLEERETRREEDVGDLCVLGHSVVSNSLRPYALQPARLLFPWDSPEQEYQSGLPRPPPGDLLDPGTEHKSLISPALAGGFFTNSTIWKALCTAMVESKRTAMQSKTVHTTADSDKTQANAMAIGSV